MCAWAFGDSFDLYAATADATAGYWDSGVIGSGVLVAGRFAGSQAVSMPNNTATFVKSSGQNDAVHHIIIAYRQTAALSGTVLGLYIQLSDGTTNQCCIVFRSDGVILLTSATPGGTVLATYSGAVTAANTWTAFEFEVIISNTVGRFRARKNGNTSDDFDSGATLNTRPGANSYANKITVAQSATLNATQFDDFLWRSDAASVPWVGDIRCYTRMPASDVSVQFARAPAVFSTTPFTAVTTSTIAAGSGRYGAFTAPADGTISSVSLSLNLGYTGNMKCALFASASGQPGVVIQSATAPITNPVAGAGNTFSFSPPVAVTKGTQDVVGFDSDTGVTNGFNAAGAGTGYTSTTPYASFPTSSPGASATNAPVFTVSVGPSSNATLVNETLQDAAATYVYSATAGQSDLYAIAALAATPVSVVAVTTRGFIQKSDAGTRNGAVQLKSGAAAPVQSTSTALSSSWGWLWRTDATDPATGAAWTPVAVSNVNIGPVVTA
jgi:hypothetical protein